MHLKSKTEIKRELGGQPLFKKLPSTPAVISYISGIQELDVIKGQAESAEPFSLQQHRKGIAFQNKSGTKAFGFGFDDIQSVRFEPVEENYQLILQPRLSKVILLSFQKADRAKIIPFFRMLPISEVSDVRDNESAKKEILELKEAFAADRLSTGEYKKSFNGIPLEINRDRIKWAKQELPMNVATGFSMGVTISSHYGVDHYEYSTLIHHAIPPFIIRFSSTKIFEKRGEYDKDMDDIHKVLFDHISRPMVCNWLDKFAQNETVEYKEFNLTRHGMLLKTRTPHVMIYWDEFVVQDLSVFRWRYTNLVFALLNSHTDRRPNMLAELIFWLNADPDRMKKLVGNLH